VRLGILVLAALGLGASPFALAGLWTGKAQFCQDRQDENSKATTSEPLPDGAMVRMGSPVFRHAAPVASLVFSPTGKVLISADDRSIRSWDVSTGKVLQTIRLGANEHFRAIAASLDGKLLAGGVGAGDEGGVRIWNVETGKLVQSIKTRTSPLVRFSNDGKTLAIADGAQIGFWSLDDGKRSRVLDAKDAKAQKIYAMCWLTNTNEIVAVGDAAGRVRIWDVESGEFSEAQASSEQITSLAYCPKNKILASASRDIRLWDKNGAAIATLARNAAWTNSIAFSPSGGMIASADDKGRVRVWETSSGKSLLTLVGHMDSVRCVAFSPDGETLATGGSDHSVRLWNVRTGKEIGARSGHEHRVRSIAFSPEGRRLASASYDKTVRIWDVQSGRETHRLDGHDDKVHRAAWSPDGLQLASASDDLTVRIWDTKDGREMRQLQHDGPVFSVAFSSDGRKLVAGADWDVSWWDTRSGRQLGKLKPALSCYSVAFFPNSDAFIFSGMAFEGRAVRLWNAANDRLIASPLDRVWDHHILVLAPDAQTVAIQFGTGVRILEVATGKVQHSLEGHSNSASAIAYTPDGKVLATGGSDEKIKLWDLASGSEITTLEATHGAVDALAFSPTGLYLAAASSDSVIRVWRSSNLYARGAGKADLDLEAVWMNLSSSDSALAYESIGLLVNRPEKSLPFLRERVQAQKATTAQRINQLLLELGDEHFVIRNRATEMLKELADEAQADLEQARKQTDSPEVSRRITMILDSMNSPSPYKRRRLRTTMVLELVGSQDALQFLDQLSKGAPNAQVTQEATSAKKRLEKIIKR